MATKTMIGNYVSGALASKQLPPGRKVNLRIEDTERGPVLAIGAFIPRWLGGWREEIPLSEIEAIEDTDTDRIGGGRALVMGVGALAFRKHERILAIVRTNAAGRLTTLKIKGSPETINTISVAWADQPSAHMHTPPVHEHNGSRA